MITETYTKVVRSRNYDGGSTSPNNYIPTVGVEAFQRLTVGGTRTHEGPKYNYRYLIANHLDATTILNASTTDIEFTGGYARLSMFNRSTKSYVQYEAMGCLVGFYELAPNLTISSDIADDAAKVNFLKKVRKAQTAIQAGVCLGEIGETIRMLKSPAKALRSGIDDYFRTLKKRRTRSPKRNRKILSETWLEYSFGWAPFLSDVEDASKALARLRERHKFKYVTDFSQVERLISEQTLEDGSGAISWRYRTKTRTEALVVYRGTVVAPVGDRLIMPARLFGFSIGNFVPTAWELIPYSFLVDYFTNVGDVISAWSAWDSKLAWKNRTVVTTSIREKETIGLIQDPFVGNRVDYHYMAPCHQRAIRKTVSRAPYVGDLVPSLRFEVPGLGLKWLNIAALAHSRRSLTPYY